jgi:hypothetical protein
VTFTANEPIQTPTVLIAGLATSVSNVADNTWRASRIASAAIPEAPISFSISIKDLASNTLPPVTAVTDGSSVFFDRTPPSITLAGGNPHTVEAATVYEDPGATAIDAIAGDLTAAIQTGGLLNMNVVGTYYRTYSVKDLAGNSAATVTTNCVGRRFHCTVISISGFQSSRR